MDNRSMIMINNKRKKIVQTDYLNAQQVDDNDKGSRKKKFFFEWPGH